MPTVVELEAPADSLAGRRAFESVRSLEFRLFGLIGDAPPLAWVDGPDRRTVDAALEADPTIDRIALLNDSIRKPWLFRLEFGSRMKLFTQLVSAHDGAVLEASARGGTWSFKLLFHDHEAASEVHARLVSYEYSVVVTRVRKLSDSASGESSLTETQYETLRTAYELGYFDVPRKITLEELAAEIGISHQALSERLRRSHAALVGETLSSPLASTHLDA